MDAQAFDRLIAEAARPSRRTALRLLASGLLGTLLPARVARAQRPDRDQDGLYDDDEVEVYGTNPDIYDSDGDLVGDGEEIYNRDNGLGGPSNPLINDNPAPPPPAADPAPPPAPTCAGLGGACAQFSDCCPGEYIQCCFNISGAGNCQDVSQTSFVCTGYADVPATGCPVGTTNCGGFCTDVSTDHGNCGACGNSCPFGSNCVTGACVAQCTGGLTNCGGVCVDLASDPLNCGACGNFCGTHPDGGLLTCYPEGCGVPF